MERAIYVMRVEGIKTSWIAPWLVYLQELCLFFMSSFHVNSNHLEQCIHPDCQSDLKYRLFNTLPVVILRDCFGPLSESNFSLLINRVTCSSDNCFLLCQSWSWAYFQGAVVHSRRPGTTEAPTWDDESSGAAADGRSQEGDERRTTG